ncbi:S-adenosyl-L-methionine-dependent methyltransferase [Phanerochaete sordida]|uniref:S-adenosyl-L-methionine-dependent methyltransferase n=1 Tax=Phanerochaete sordida TaxID=48140 RepID=A0A9P3G0Y3_9APHY|nr:S-adenosyl-L-methionine-dependent methyltransferase [Phanerochaete sordida]
MTPSLHAKSRPSSLLSRHSSRKSSAISQEQHGDFVYRYGSKLHAYSKDIAPYPFSYDREVMEMNFLDRALIYRTKEDACTFTDYKTDPPKRCLDLGCGTGSWTVDAAKKWKNCSFIGFDLVDTQFDLNFVEPSVAKRIKWMHGNFFDRLPFEDNEFDHVHLFTIALSVPEDKWHHIFDEINRVLKPGGHVEQIEEDGRFPTLPRWFTQPLHNAVKRASHKNNAELMAQIKYYEVPASLPHDHALLEQLFYSVFENRFINSRPSSILPGYFSATFNHVVSPPILYFPMPPLAPLPPFPRETVLPLRPAPATMHLDTNLPPSSATPSPLSASTHSTTLVNSSFNSSFASRSSESASRPSSAGLSPAPQLPTLERVDSISTIGSSDESIHSGTGSSLSTSPSVEKANVLPALADMGETVQIGGSEAYELFGMEALGELDEHTLFLHLQRAVGLVYAAKEAMWEELRILVAQGPSALSKFGWDDSEYTEEASRERFDAMFERYKADMHARVALWHPMMQYGWTYPRQDPMTETEMADQEQLRRSILEARMLAKEEEIQPTLRVIRLLVGRKDH